MPHTRIIVQAELDSPDKIFLRGEGLANLSWEKGVKMNQEKLDEWVFETDELFSDGEFKVLINDKTYELGESHHLYPGASIRVNPKFPTGD